MSAAFTLSQREDGLATLTFDLTDRSVNVFNRAVMEEFVGWTEKLAARSDIRVLVLLSGKPRTFIAGADIEEIARISGGDQAEEGSRAGHRVFDAWEALPFPTVAAVRGTCVGGGTELSLASDYIVISDREDVRMGLPEVKLGIVPGWGGCTRLPKRVGLAAALDIILAGKTVRPSKAFKIGLADALLPDATFLDEVREFALRAAAGEVRRRRKSDFKQRLLEGNPLGRKLVFDQARKQVLKQTRGHYPAPLRALEVVRAGVERGARAGFEAEARAIGELASGAISKNLVHLFGLMEGAKRGGDKEAARAIRNVAVLGAGAMGGGIAQITADKLALPVRMKDIGDEQLALGMAHAAKLFDTQVRRRWISKPEAARKIALIHPTLDYSGFENADLVVEAVIEDLGIKRKVFADLEERVQPAAILASNTSSLSIDLIAEQTRHPERVIGMHFFNPVHKMPLLEIIRGSKTSDPVAATVFAFALALGKTPVIVKDGPGFLVNRLLGFTMAEALWLLDEGHAIEDLDRAVAGWGMPMGPFTLSDEVGIDVGTKVGHILAEAFGDRLAFPDWLDRMVEDGRLGAKSLRGYYRYADGKRTDPDPSVYRVLGLPAPVRRAEADRINDRILLPMINEAARCLAEGVVASPGELDLAMIMGTGFPPFRGGPCRWADSQGVAALRQEMERLATSVGDRYAPSEALVAAAEGGGFYATFGSG